jgi:hypothetical protein
MSSTSDSGHAKNVANLSKLNQIIITFGGNYNPANKHINLASLQALQSNADQKLLQVNTALSNWKNATNKREIAFQGLDKFSTKLLASLQSMDVAEQTVDDFKALVKKVRGTSKLTKADAGKTSPDPALADPSNPTPIVEAGNSNSQQSFDNKIEHFGKMVLTLQNERLYTPNEAGFSVADLGSKLTELGTLNDEANASSANLKAARIDRNTYFYAKGTGVLDIVKQTKAYIKSLYGATSQQYKATNAIKFYRVLAVNKAV